MPSYPLDDPAATLHALAMNLQRTLGGTSGPLYSAFFLRASTLLREQADNPENWAKAFLAGCSAITELGGARQGDRTMLDALLPAATAFQAELSSGHSPERALSAAVVAAQAGASATRTMLSRRGRSSYLGERVLGHPDPGAEAVAVWLEACRNVW
jgi:dihydroxyacetone kinase